MSNILPPKSTLKVKFEHQHTDEQCGAACAVMILKTIGAAHPNQTDLFKEIQKFTTRDQGRGKEKWESSPDGLQDRLNWYSKPNYYFKLFARRPQSEITRIMISTIFQYKTACITLISSGIHWVVVYGCKKKGDPITSPNGFRVRDLTGIYTLDPLFRSPNQGITDYHEWIKHIQNPEMRGCWARKYIALCDPDPPDDKKRKNVFSNMKKKPGKDLQGQLNEANLLSATDSKVPLGTDKPPENQSGNPPKSDIPIIWIKTHGPDNGLINDKTARDYSMWHLKFSGFYDPVMFERMMINPGPGKPMLVRALDSKDFWYIVPFIEMNKKKGGVMRINAKNAKFQEAAFAMYEDKPLAVDSLSDKQITKRLIDKYGSIKGKIVIDPILVWKPCVESYSRFLPFYKVKMGAKTVYVRVDGKVYPRLTQRKIR